MNEIFDVTSLNIWLASPFYHEIDKNRLKLNKYLASLFIIQNANQAFFFCSCCRVPHRWLICNRLRTARTVSSVGHNWNHLPKRRLQLSTRL